MHLKTIYTNDIDEIYVQNFMKFNSFFKYKFKNQSKDKRKYSKKIKKKILKNWENIEIFVFFFFTLRNLGVKF